MAFTGSYTHYTETFSDTEYVTSSISYPVDLPLEDDNYDKRGTTEIVSQSAIIYTPTTYEGKYFFVSSAALTALNYSDKNEVYCSYLIKMYDNQDHKNQDLVNNPILSIDEIFEWDWDTMSNPVTEAYNHFDSINTSGSLTSI
jgi:hypothetical protein